ncbi:urea ABC transporter permease subunit UrtB [Aquimarina sp. RZ0]|uniref:urea ABC transporter permease subunit UrtB n=1 Tax=Aquimarina sp. RZ0 TaxID=2607730 RepID=UPI001CB71ECB|nr:urea ABC transporter permease subunit UrtB [Aquimarina sp. RZ0]
MATKRVAKVIRFLVLLIPLISFAQTNNDIRLLMSPDKNIKSEAFSRLLTAKKVTTFPVLNAINGKKLFTYKDNLVTIGEKNGTSDKVTYKVLLLFPEIKVLKDANDKALKIPMSELKAIKFSRKERLSIIPLLPHINLTSTDKDLRKLAYTQFQNKPQFDNLPILEKAFAKETDIELMRFAKETIIAIQLQNEKSAEKQLLHIKNLKENKGDNTVFLLNDFLEKNNDIDAKVEKKIGQAVTSLNDRATRIDWIQNLFSGLSLGSILILIALGLSIIYGLAGVINMAHGEFMMIGAYTTFCVQEIFKMISGGPLSDAFFWCSIPVAFLVSGVFGLVIERLIIRKLYGSPLQSLLATWGVSLVFIQLARTVFGDLTSVKAPALLSGGWHVAPQLVLPYNRIFIIIITVVMIILTFLFLYKSRFGLRIRSVTQNRNMSACLGISTKKIDAMTFFIGSGIAGIAGCCMTLIGNIVPDMGQTYIVDSFLVVVTGGVGNLMGTIVAGLGIGQFTKILEPIFHAVYGKVIILGIIIFFLQFKPKGLFPPKGRIADD